MSHDPAEILRSQNMSGAVLRFDASQERADRGHRHISAVPPSFVVDEIARDEWQRVHTSMFGDGELSMAQCSLLAGYCNAVARAVRAEQILAEEGRYYQTRTKVGSVMRRRHPAAHDAEQGWTAARHLAKQLGITGGPLCESGSEARRNVFK
jgi:phage terminase small subunit